MFEINLVPDVKSEMLKAQKVRNIVLFVCAVVVAVAGGVIAILGGIKAGQDITMSGQDDRLEAMSAKINSFDDLDELLTVQKQLNSLNTVSEEKVLLSRIFSVVNVLLPRNGDEISLSELDVDIEKNLIKFDAQADARVEPLVDYRVLDAFKKSMSMMKYDYGTGTADGYPCSWAENDGTLTLNVGNAFIGSLSYEYRFEGSTLYLDDFAYDKN